MLAVGNVGRVAIGGPQNQISITAVKSITLPTAAQRVPLASITGAAKILTIPTLEMWLTLEAQNARLTTDGTVPSAVNGHLLSAGGIGPFVFTGEQLIASMKLLSPVAGGLISYSFYYLEAM
jgi:hypothetical protein